MNYITKREYEELEKAIIETEKKVNRAIKEKADSGSGQDTWHDEGFKQNLVEEAMWRQKLKELKKTRNSLIIIEPEEQDEVAEIGNGVEVEYENGETFKFILEGLNVSGKMSNLSIYSPLGKAVWRAREEDKVKVNIGHKEHEVIVKNIIFPSKAKEIFS